MQSGQIHNRIYGRKHNKTGVNVLGKMFSIDIYVSLPTLTFLGRLLPKHNP